MIYIDRNSVNIPSILNSNKTKAEIRRMGEFFLKKERQKQIRYEFRNYYAHREVKDALKTLFHGKCAYCERQIDKSDLMVIDHFRPKVMAMNLDGKIDESHYWWVAYDWNNLYPSCSVCNQSKRTRFPVEGKRVNYLEDLSKEKSLLLDPGNKSDFADQHFSFTEWGEIIGLTDRGQATIEVLNLNRMSLQLERAQVIEQIKVLVLAP